MRRRFMFPAAAPSPWQTQQVGGGFLRSTGDRLQLCIGPTDSGRYANAQLDDYQLLPRRRFPWRPPLKLTVRARFSHPVGELRGTAGFGFWNDPFGMTGRCWPTLPRAIWFFFNGMDAPLRLARETPGHGWRAAVIDAWRTSFLLLAPSTPVAMLLMRWRWLYERAWPLAQWAMGVREAMVEGDLTAWRTYELWWGRDTATFAVDGVCVLKCNTAPSGPLGLVFWMDNQGIDFAPWRLPRQLLFVTPQEQWLELAWAEIET